MDTNDPVVRAREDMETVRQAVGLALPFGREDVIASLLMSAGIGALGLLSLFAKGHWLIAAAVALLLLSVLGMVWLRLKYRRSSGRSPIRRKEYTIALVGGAILFLGLTAFFEWSLKVGTAGPYKYTAVLFALGLGFLLIGILDSARRRFLASAAGLFALALAIPWFWDGPIVAVVCAVSVLAGLADAAIMAFQLRKIRATG